MTWAQPPRVWPIALACVVAALGTLALSALALSALALEAGATSFGAEQIRPLLGESHTQLLLLTCQSLAFALTAVVAASLGPLPPAERLDVRRGAIPSVRRPFAAVAMVFATLSVGAMVYSALLLLKGADDDGTLRALEDAILSVQGPDRPWMLLEIALFAPLAEELFFRGYVQTRLVARFGVWPGIVLASTLFGLAHFDPVQSPATFAMGLVLGYGAVRAESVWLPVVGHVVNNSLAFAAAGGDAGATPQDSLQALALYAPCAFASLLALERITRAPR